MDFNFSNVFGTAATVAEGKPVEIQAADKAARSKTKGEDKVIAYFKALGIAVDDIQPRVKTKTFEQWKREGRIVKKGQHGCQLVCYKKYTKNTDKGPKEITAPFFYRCFHISQTTELVPAV